MSPAAAGGTALAGKPAATSKLQGLHPAYFAMVMATGIVSIAAHLHEIPAVAWPLFAWNLAAYPVLWTLNVARLWRHPAAVREDILHHGRSLGFFSMVPATSILGSQCLLIAGAPRVATVFWCVALVLLVALTYGVFTVLTVKKAKPALAEGLHGGWLLAIVATQSVAGLGAQLAPKVPSDALLFFSLVAWLAGGMLYIWIISLIFYRYTFFTLSPSDLTPPYWVNMGAVAISTLAGTLLAATAPASPLVTELLPFIKGLTLLWWATATWWIPMLLILGYWRHVVSRFPLRYDPLYWGAVFPLGMYATCTFRLAGMLPMEGLRTVARVALAIAIAAWLLTFAGFAASFIRTARAAESR